MADPKPQNNNQWFHDILNHGLETFIDYWGYKDIANRWKTKGSLPGGQYSVIERVEELQAAQEYDPSGITTYMLLRAYLHDLLQNTTYTASDMILNWKKHQAEFDRIALMRANLEEPEAIQILKRFELEVKSMAGHYKAKNLPKISKIIEDPIDSAFLRQSAYKATNRTLKVHQFLQGSGSTGPLKIHKYVYEFWNINSLVNAAAHQLFDGVALCLIRDVKTPFASFFCFAVKAGETLTILTDREKGAHPRYHEMTRRPDRDLSSRWNLHWFPYSLLEVEQSKDGKRLYLKDREQLVRYNAQLVKLAAIGDLHPEEVIWIGLMLDLIGKKYGSANPVLLPNISYTAEMIRIPDALVPGNSSLIVQGKYKPIELPRITADDLTPEKTKDNFRRKTTGVNRSIFDRFKDRVPEDALNLIGDNDVKLLRASNKKLAEQVPGEWPSDDPMDRIELRSFNPVDFGSQEELDKDRIWTARFNQCSIIDNLAEKEFETKKDSVIKWYQDHVKANQSNLIPYIALLECNVFSEVWDSHRGNSFPSEDKKSMKVENILSYYVPRKILHIGYDWQGKGSVLFAPYQDRPFRYLCFSDGITRASIQVSFRPRIASHLAFLAGVEVDDLPIQIRHWMDQTPYRGNSILDRIDPEDWIIRDRFRDIKFKVTFTISKTYFARLRKERGLDRFEFIKPEHEDE